MAEYKRLGVIGRFQPLHTGAQVMLEHVCELGEEVIIGIGSTNKYDYRNPFTVEERYNMIHLALPRFDNYVIEEIPDYGHIPEYSDGQRWKEEILHRFGELDAFVTGNAYARDLLKDHYEIIHPASLIPKQKQIYNRGTLVRRKLALDEGWESLVPESIVHYIKQFRLDQRFRNEFGLETIAATTREDWLREDQAREKQNVNGGGLYV